MRAPLISVLLLASCAGGPRPADALARLSLDDLVAEACSPAARAPSYVRYDEGYRPAVVRELAQRLGWSPDDVQRVTAGKVWVGASKEQVLAAWGRPTDTMRQVSRSGELQLWTYGTPLGPHSIVELHAGTCSSVTHFDR